MKAYLRVGDDYLEQAKAYSSKRAACVAFRREAEELAEYDQTLEASIHYANSKAELVEYPDFVLSLGPRGGLKVERT